MNVTQNAAAGKESLMMSQTNSHQAALRAIPIMQVSVVDFTMSELLREVQAGVQGKDGRIIAHHNLHSVYLHHRNLAFRNFYKRLVLFAPIDGMPLIWISRLYGRKIPRDRRLTYVDFLPHMLKLADGEAWRVFYVGSQPDTCARGSRVIGSRYPGVRWRATHGYFDVTTEGTQNQEVLQQIRDFKPDILMVGMGMPRQEKWIAVNRDSLAAGVILPCGAAVDYIAEAIPTPPRWAGRMGCEWLFRLWAEPRRLAHRYLVEPWYLIYVLFEDLANNYTSRDRSTPRTPADDFLLSTRRPPRK